MEVFVLSGEMESDSTDIIGAYATLDEAKANAEQMEIDSPGLFDKYEVTKLLIGKEAGIPNVVWDWTVNNLVDTL